jgi:hypothetical protein
MDYAARNVQLGAAYVASIVAAQGVRAAAALLVGSKLRLSKDPVFNPLYHTVIADLAALECTFTNYPAGGFTPTYVSPANVGDGIVGMVTNVIAELTAGAPTVGNVIYGWWIDDGVNFVAGEKMAVPGGVVLSAPGDYLSLLACIPFGSQFAVSL